MKLKMTLRAIAYISLAMIPACHRELPREKPSPLDIVDEDNDGNADMIQTNGRVHWIADGYFPKSSAYDTAHARVMTPEIRKAATEALKYSTEFVSAIARINDKKYNNQLTAEIKSLAQKATIAQQRLDFLIH